MVDKNKKRTQTHRTKVTVDKQDDANIKSDPSYRTSNVGVDIEDMASASSQEVPDVDPEFAKTSEFPGLLSPNRI